jgi:hypothetical protein
MLKSLVSVPDMMSSCLKSHDAKTVGDLACTHETNKGLII